MSTAVIAALTLTTPMMLGGLLLLSLPIAAHLMHRRARRQIQFPTVALLMESAASQSQLFKLRRLLVLLLRCLAVALVVLAFARPLWEQTPAAGTPAAEGGAAVVLLLDASAATGEMADGVSTFQTLQAGGARVLDDLEPGSDVGNLVVAAARPRAAFPAMTGNFAALRRELDTAQPTAQRADFHAAMALAGRLLAEHEGPRHLVVLSNLQVSNWRGIDRRLAEQPVLPEGTQITLVPPSTAPQANISLSEPSVRPHTPLAGQSTQVGVKVANHGPRPRTIRIDMLLDDEPAESQSVRLEPRQQREVAFTVRLERRGVHEVSFHTDDDGLVVDNRAHLVVPVAERAPIVVIGDESPDEPGTATYFTIRALAPYADMRDRYEVRHLSSSDVTARRLGDAPVVFVAYTGQMPERALQALHEHVQRGGGLMMFCGEGPIAQNLEALDALSEEGLVPFALDALQRGGVGGELLRITEGEWRSDMLSEFDERAQAVLSGIRLTQRWSVGGVHEQARILLRYGDAAPALAERRAGRGRVMLANFSPALGAGDLGKHGTFVALVQAMAESLQPAQRHDREVVAGALLRFDAAVAPDAAGPGLELIGPGGRTLGEAEFASGADGLTVTLAAADEPGFYRIRQGQRILGSAAVNVDPREGDLRRLDKSELSDMLAAPGQRVRVRTVAGDARVLELRGEPVWGWLLAAALAAMALELAIVGYWRR